MTASNKTRKAYTKKSSAASNGNAQERALDLFADMMIEKIETIQQDWKKPWFTQGMGQQWPRNLSGRYYNGMNSLMLIMHCEKNGYEHPIFCTFDRVSDLNFTRTTKGLKPAVDKDGNRLPQVSVKKGESSFPVFITVFKVVNPDDGSSIPYEDYKKLTQQEREKYNVFLKLQVYNVFNIDQTNMAEARPDLYQKAIADCTPVTPMPSKDMKDFEPVDRMIQKNLWICPIIPTFGDDAYYSVSKDCVVIPEKKQFKSGESFYSNLFHEMAHSTGSKKHLDRLKPTHFGSDDYAKEELVAELTAALVAQFYGMDKHIKEDSAAYLKCWLDSLKKDASFIKTILLDVKRASAMMTSKIDEVINTIKAAAAS